MINRLKPQLENKLWPLFASDHLKICPGQPSPICLSTSVHAGHWEMWQSVNISITMSLVSEVWMEEVGVWSEPLRNMLSPLWDWGGITTLSPSFNLQDFCNIPVVLALSHSFFINYPVTIFPEDSIFSLIIRKTTGETLSCWRAHFRNIRWEHFLMPTCVSFCHCLAQEAKWPAWDAQQLFFYCSMAHWARKLYLSAGLLALETNIVLGQNRSACSVYDLLSCPVCRRIHSQIPVSV